MKMWQNVNKQEHDLNLFNETINIKETGSFHGAVRK